MKKAISFILLAVQLLILSACSNGRNGTASTGSSGSSAVSVTASGYDYSQRDIEGFSGSVGALCVWDGWVYFSASEAVEEDKAVTRLYSYDCESEAVTELLEFDIALMSDAPSCLAAFGGRIYAAANSFTGEGDDEKTIHPVYLLNTDGSDLETMYLEDAEGLSSVNGFVSKIAADSDGRLYILHTGSTEGRVSVIDPAGMKLLFEFNVKIDANIVKTSDGGIAVAQSSESGYIISAVDVEKKGLTELTALDGTYSCLDGGEFYLYLCTGNAVYGFDPETGGLTELVDWTVQGVRTPSRVVPLPSGDIIYSAFGDTGFTLSRLCRGEASEEKSDTVTLAVMSDEFGYYANMVVEFNNRSKDVKMALVNYSDFNSSGAVEKEDKLALDIITGNAPDIILFSNEISISNFASKGILEDLYPYIDSDPQLSREDFYDNILKAAEIDGCLYEFIPRFYIQTVIGRTAEVGEGYSWTTGQYRDFVEKNGYTNIFGEKLSRNDFLTLAMSYNSSEFINWKDNTCDFENDSFAVLLEMASTIPEKSGIGPEAGAYETWYSEERALITKEQALTYSTFDDPSTIDKYIAVFDQDISFIGFPCSSGNGSSIMPSLSFGILSSSENKEAAWDFVRHFALPEGQNAFGIMGIPTTKAAIQDRLEAYKYQALNYGENVFLGINFTIDYTSSPDYTIPKFLELLQSLDKIYRPDYNVNRIVLEEAGAYFADDKSLEETIRLIQDRVSIYLAEKS